MTRTPSPSLAERLASPKPHLRVGERSARELMTPGVVALPVTATLQAAADAMAAHHVHGILAVSCEGAPLGWVTADAVLSRSGSDRSLQWAVDAIGEELVSVRPTAPADEVVRKLSEEGVNRVAVQDRPGLMPEGVITNLDVAAHVGRHGA